MRQLVGRRIGDEIHLLVCDEHHEDELTEKVK